MNKKLIEKSFENILFALNKNENIDQDVFAETPRRMVALYEEIFSGLSQDPKEFFTRTYPISSNDLIIEKDVTFFSTCEHHLLPFFGKISIGYIPNGKIIGFGDIVKVVEAFSKRPQLQERLAEQIATTIYENLNCNGVCVYIEAEHLCMTMRGVKKPGSKIVTVSSKGVFEDSNLRTEFFNLIRS